MPRLRISSVHVERSVDGTAFVEVACSKGANGIDAGKKTVSHCLGERCYAVQCMLRGENDLHNSIHDTALQLLSDGSFILYRQKLPLLWASVLLGESAQPGKPTACVVLAFQDGVDEAVGDYYDDGLQYEQWTSAKAARCQHCSIHSIMTQCGRGHANDVVRAEAVLYFLQLYVPGRGVTVAGCTEGLNGVPESQ